MTALSRQPTNPAFLSPLGFKFQIKKLPTVEYFVQTVNIPSVSLGTADVDTPFTRIPFPGTRLTFGNLEVTFRVDEDMKNYMEIFNWMQAIGFPDNFEQYQAVANQPKYSGEGILSDISLIILSSAMNPTQEVLFQDCFPVDLSQIIFDSTSADVEYISATATFANRRFSVKAL